MGRNVVRGALPEVMRRAHSYLFYRAQEAAAKKEKDAATSVAGDKRANWLRNFVLEHGEQVGKDYVFEFAKPLEIDGVTYRGFKAQGSEDQFMDEDDARELLDRKGLTDRIRREITVEVWDWDELYVLNQEGLIEDGELDGLFTTETAYSLQVIK